MRPTLPALLAFALAVAAFSGVPSASAAPLSVVNCSASYGCAYVGDDGKVYNPQGNGEIGGATDAKTVSTYDGGSGLKYSKSSSSPFDLFGGSAAPWSSVDKMSNFDNSAVFLSGSTARWCLTYGCYPQYDVGGVKDVDIGYTANWPYYQYVSLDGTSNVCPGSDNAALWISSGNDVGGNYGSRYVCKKNDGSFVTDVPGSPSIPTGTKQIAGSQHIFSPAAFCWIKSDDTMGCSGGAFAKTGKWRDIAVSSKDFVCAVNKDTDFLSCWDSNGTVFATSTHKVAKLPSSGNSSSGSYCVESPTSSGSYSFAPLVSTSVQSADSSWIGTWNSYVTEKVAYKFNGLDVQPSSYFTGALLGTNSEGEGFSFEPSAYAPAVTPYVDIRANSGTVSYLRVYGITSGNPVDYYAVFEKGDGSVEYRFLRTYSSFGQYVKYSGSERLVGFRLEFPDLNSRFSVYRFEIGNQTYVPASATKTVCYDKATHDQLVQFGTGASSSFTGALDGVGYSTYIGLVAGGSGSVSFSGGVLTVTGDSPVSSYFSGCPDGLDKVDIGFLSFLDWGFSGKIPIIGYELDFHPFRSLGCPVKALVFGRDMFR